MPPLKKNHLYSLFISSQSQSVIIFKNPVRMSLILRSMMGMVFFAAYFTWVRTLPETAADKTVLQFFTLGMGIYHY